MLLCGCDRDTVARLESLYRARAQVMSRDEGTGLWRPLYGGGMSVVELSQVPATSDDVIDHAEAYYIIGRKENDVSRCRDILSTSALRRSLCRLDRPVVRMAACRHNISTANFRTIVIIIIVIVVIVTFLLHSSIIIMPQNYAYPVRR